MKVIISGGRDYRLSSNDLSRLDALEPRIPITEVVSGGARGVDACGESWARARAIPVKRFTAHWDKQGKKAGPVRNAKMAEYADALVVFPGGSGTDDMVRKAVAAKLRIYDLRTSRSK